MTCLFIRDRDCRAMEMLARAFVANRDQPYRIRRRSCRPAQNEGKSPLVQLEIECQTAKENPVRIICLISHYSTLSTVCF